MTAPLLIRSWTPADVPALARILAAGWQQAYGGFMSPAALGPRTDPAYRAQEIGAWLEGDFDAWTEMLHVAESGGEVRGFVSARLGDKEGLGTAGFVPLLYVAPQAQRRGVGARLLEAAAAWIDDRRPGAVAIPAFEQNPFRGFYNRIGGSEAKRIAASVDGHEWPVVIYLWPSAASLREGLAASGRLLEGGR